MKEKFYYLMQNPNSPTKQLHLFINDAKQESIDTILELAELRKSGRLKALIVTGCLAQRYKDEIQKEIPEVDEILGTTAFDKVVESLEEII